MLIFSFSSIIIKAVIIMKLTIYKINEIPDFQKKLASLCEDTTFLKFDSSVKKYLFTEKCESNMYHCVGLMCENFLELSLIFTLAEIADLLEKGIALVLKDNPEISQIKIYKEDGKEQLYCSSASKIQIDTIRAIASTQIRKKHGRANAVIDEDFVDDYWKWQLGECTVNEILSNTDRNYSFSTKQQFYSMAQKYEKTNSYYFNQKAYAKSLVRNKKRGKVNLSGILDYINKNENTGLNNKTISSLMKILGVNEIDFWRCMKKLYMSRYFRDLKDTVFKKSIGTAMKVLDEIDSDYFTNSFSTCVDFTKPLEEIIIDLEKFREKANELS